jgi:hypothetical protein
MTYKVGWNLSTIHTPYGGMCVCAGVCAGVCVCGCQHSAHGKCKHQERACVCVCVQHICVYVCVCVYIQKFCTVMTHHHRGKLSTLNPKPQKLNPITYHHRRILVFIPARPSLIPRGSVAGKPAVYIYMYTHTHTHTHTHTTHKTHTQT